MTRTARVMLPLVVAALHAAPSLASSPDPACIQTLASMFGELPGAYLGNAIAGGGDFNGDGYQDVLFGSERYNSVGRAYLLFGGPGPHDEPDLVFGGGDLSGVRFGASVAWAGDVNGDGFDDILVGDPLRSYGQGRQGHVYLYLGGAHPDTTRDMRFFATHPDHTQFGTSVAGADFNADGYDDVLIGEPGASSSVYVYFGGPHMDDQADLRIWRGAQALGFGSTLAGLGDFNGDGFDDVAIGWPIALNLGQSRVYVSYGGPSSGGVLNLTLASAFPEDRMGFSLAGPGDVNGDGFADLLVGAPAAGAGDAGRAHVYLGGLFPSLAPARTHEGSATMRLGTSVAGAGDVDGDARNDYLIGAPGSGTLWDPRGVRRDRQAGGRPGRGRASCRPALAADVRFRIAGRVPDPPAPSRG